MSLEQNGLEKLASLARIKMDSESLTKYQHDLNRILSLVEQLQQADTTDIEPLAHPLDIIQPLREDEVSESDQSEKFQRLAEETENNLYLVPKVLD